ncbi:uncharacterized protein [Miscanthus floridulus]|uniref:uncharacterized protein n=1 Tax=Miscanthus floridulus TaxID=154761 RepID=UPI0034594309
MKAYCTIVRRLEDKFDGLELNHVARKFNEAADELAKMASARTPVPPNVFTRDLHKPSVDYASAIGEGPSTEPTAGLEAPSTTETSPAKPEAMAIDAEPPKVDQGTDWRVPFLDRLVRGELPADRSEARRLARRAKTYVLCDGELYRRSPSGILQRCITTEAGQSLLRDLHAGVCGHHAAPRTLVGNAFRQGFYWPTAVADATKLVRSCEGCQYYARQTHLPAQALQTIPITWPFAVWGLDIFTGRKFLTFCDDHHIRVAWSAVGHPRTNGQVERANGMILQGLKPRIFNQLKKFGKKWLAELPSVIWSLRNTPSRATGFTPFFLVYGAEAILPTDLEYGSPRLQAYNEQSNRTAREDALDQLEEARDVALLHSARYQQALRRYQARRVPTDLQAIGGGFAEGLSEAKTQQLEDEVEDTAKKLAGDIDLFGKTDNNGGAQ